MAQTTTTGLVRAALAGTLCMALSACFPGGGDGEGDDEREPAVIATITPELLFMAPGDRATARLEVRGTGGNKDFDLERIEHPRSPGEPGEPDVTVELDHDIITDLALLRVAAGAGAAPGIYRFPVGFSLGGVDRERDLTVVVLPDDTAPSSGAVAAMAAGDTHSLALLEDGSVWAWGRNDHGQLGDGTFVDRQVPVRVGVFETTVVAVAAGGAHSLALLEDGSVWAWGDNRRGQANAGDGFDAGYEAYPLPVPARDTSDVAFTDAVAIAAGKHHSALLTNAGQVRVWGSNARGQLGDTNISEAARSATASLPVVTIQAIAAGAEHTLALATDNSAWGWGASDRGQLGSVVSEPDQRTPIDIGFVSGVVGLGAGQDHTLLVLDDGNVGGLGANTFGQLGDGSLQTPIAQPTRPPRLLNVRAADGGWLHSLALQANGEVWAWGSNDFGQVSDSAEPAPDTPGRQLQLVPQRVLGVPLAETIAAGGRHSLALDRICGKPWSWGDNGVGQLGDGSAYRFGTVRARPQPVYGLGDTVADAGCRRVLTVVANGPGSFDVAGNGLSVRTGEPCEAPCADAFDPGARVSLTATPRENARFLSWGGNCAGDTATIEVTMDRSRACVARFGRPPVPAFTLSPNPYVPVFDLDVRVDASGSTDDGEIVAWEWDFDNDGVFDASGEQASYEYRTTGEHPIRLRVTDNEGVSAELVQILVAGNLPRASFTVAPAQPLAGQSARFDAGASTSSNGAIVSYEWHFDNDNVADATGQIVEYTFASAGTYRVQLRVFDSIGLRGTLGQDVVVSDAPAGGDPVLSVENHGGGGGDVNASLGFSCAFAGAASTPMPCAGTAEPGQEVQLTAFAGDGSVFSHWGIGDCDSEVMGDGLTFCNVTMNASRTVRVYFE